MILTWLILIPALAGLLAWLAGRRAASAARWIALAATLGEFLLVVGLWAGHGWDTNAAATVGGAGQVPGGSWLLGQRAPWIPGLGIAWFLALDGLSLLMVALTAFIGVLAVLVSWREIQERTGLFYAMLLWVLTGIYGVFLALDLFLFYFFWEVMLIPMYFLIGIWGHGRRIYAAVKFFVFTLASGLLMLLAILGLHFEHARATGIHTFDYTLLLGTAMAPATAMWLMLGFFAAFAVKLPAVPVHNWLPDAHSEAPTAGSVILAALLLKTGAYGLIRFVVPLFPGAAHTFTPVAMALGVVGIVYGAVLAFAQTDFKRLVAYTSVSHMGFVLLGVFAWNELALQGTVMQMICHGISTGALFMLAGMIYERLHTREITAMGGLWTAAPRMGALAMVFAMASLGLPGLGNFVGEFLILFGTYKVSMVAAVIATIGVVFATVYSLWIMQRVFQGPKPAELRMADLTPRETLVLGVLVVAIVWLGVYPRPILETVRPALQNLRPAVEQVAPADPIGGGARR
jgi:NADH-quinone oxidoreductase subunit M